MSLTEFNNKKVLYHPQTGIKVNKSKYFGYNESASSIFRKKLNEVIFGRGVDDYVLNEFKKDNSLTATYHLGSNPIGYTQYPFLLTIFFPFSSSSFL